MDLARLHRPLVRMAPASTMPEQDGLAAEDDLMCRRLRHCTQCGRGAVPGDHQAVVYIPGRIVAAVRCQRCAAADPTMAALHALLRQRYGTNNGKE